MRHDDHPPAHEQHHPPGHHPPPPPAPPPHHYHPPPRHERHEFWVLIRAMEMLAVRMGSNLSIEDLIQLADRTGEQRPAELLRGFDPHLDATLAIAKLDADLAVEAAVRRRVLHDSVTDRRIGLIVPVPPHLHERFGSDSNIITFVPDDEGLPPHLRRLPVDRLVRGNRLCRSELSSMDIIVCEVFRNSQLSVAASVADLLDERILAPATRLLALVRPHTKDDDLPLRDAIAARIEFY